MDETNNDKNALEIDIDNYIFYESQIQQLEYREKVIKTVKKAVILLVLILLIISLYTKKPIITISSILLALLTMIPTESYAKVTTSISPLKLPSIKLDYLKEAQDYDHTRV